MIPKGANISQVFALTVIGVHEKGRTLRETQILLLGWTLSDGTIRFQQEQIVVLKALFLHSRWRHVNIRPKEDQEMSVRMYFFIKVFLRLNESLSFIIRQIWPNQTVFPELVFKKSEPKS